MLDFSRFERILVIAPHADDEVLGAGGLMALAHRAGAKVDCIFMAVDGLKHWGHPEVTNVEERVAEIEAVAERVGFDWEILYKGRVATFASESTSRCATAGAAKPEKIGTCTAPICAQAWDAIATSGDIGR